MNRTITGIAALILLAGCAGTNSTGETVEPAAETTTAAQDTPTPEPEPAAEPDGDYESSCDYLLDFDSGHTFVASAFITNTGEVGFVAKVTATWRQANGDHVKDSKKVDVPVGDEVVEVYFEEDASGSEIDSIQSLDTDKQCKVEVEMVDLL